MLFWAAVTGIPAWSFGKPTLKRHNPRTNRKNRDNSQYRGCLSLYVRRSAELYRRVEGLWAGMASAYPAS